MASVILFVYAAIMAIIGVEAYVVKQSLPSLLGGLAAAILASVCAILCKQNPKVGIGAGVIVVLVFAGRFIGSLMKGAGGFYPSGLIVLLSVGTVIGLVISLLQSKRI